MVYKTEGLYFGNPVTIRCDGKCHKAWGLSGRPCVHLKGELDEDDRYWLPDQDLGNAPTTGNTVGVSEGSHMKPSHAENDGHNKWCARECERSVIDDEGEHQPLPDFTKPYFNINPEGRYILDENGRVESEL